MTNMPHHCFVLSYNSYLPADSFPIDVVETTKSCKCNTIIIIIIIIKWIVQKTKEILPMLLWDNYFSKWKSRIPMWCISIDSSYTWICFNWKKAAVFLFIGGEENERDIKNKFASLVPVYGLMRLYEEMTKKTCCD